MSVKQSKSGKWLAQVDRVGIPRVRRSFDVKSDAEKFEREYLVSHQKIDKSNTDRRTLLELVGIWYRYHGVNLGDGVARNAILEQMAVDLGNIPAVDLTPGQFLEYRYACLNTHDKKVTKKFFSDRDQKSITAKTFNNRHGYLDAVYRKLRKLKIINYESPIADTDMIKVHERQLGYLSESQIEQLFELLRSCRNQYVWWIAQLCIRTGARWGEVEMLTKKQLHAGKVTFEFTKSKKIRSVPLDPGFYEQLQEFSKYKNPEDRIFKNSITAFYRVVAKSSLEFNKGQATHILRHSFASYFIMNGGNILTLQKILGHSDIKMTMRYAHLAPDHLMDAVKFNPLSDN